MSDVELSRTENRKFTHNVNKSESRSRRRRHIICIRIDDARSKTERMALENSDKSMFDSIDGRISMPIYCCRSTIDTPTRNSMCRNLNSTKYVEPNKGIDIEMSYKNIDNLNRSMKTNSKKHQYRYLPVLDRYLPVLSRYIESNKII
ncbi:unnamed protein product [Nesidiocoris tenuis]|uniref:Uncharacterized protein n=1 Tax=Nesidiocoris tenuis TaxID=355587 RepID=A0A6H5HRH0_9HEMI|nr:unnamed protein product [Nesidiocoris tenuis]